MKHKMLEIGDTEALSNALRDAMAMATHLSIWETKEIVGRRMFVLLHSPDCGCDLTGAAAWADAGAALNSTDAAAWADAGAAAAGDAAWKTAHIAAVAHERKAK